MFVGPMLVSVAFQSYLYLTARIVVHAEALVTQLVLEHSLRIRLVAEDPHKKSENAHGTASADASEDEQSNPSSKSSENTAIDSTASESETTTKDLSSMQNLVGKINNLITTDALAITNAKDFLEVGMKYFSQPQNSY